MQAYIRITRANKGLIKEVTIAVVVFTWCSLLFIRLGVMYYNTRNPLKLKLERCATLRLNYKTLKGTDV